MRAPRAARIIALALAALALGACMPKPKPAVKKAPIAVSKSDAAKAENFYIEGVYAYAEGETAKAMAAWKKCLALNPRHAAAKKAMAEAQAKLEAVKKLK